MTEKASNSHPFQLHNAILQLIWVDWASRARSLRSFGPGPSWTHPVAALVRLGADQAHEHLMAQLPDRQRMPILAPTQGLPTLNPEVLDKLDHVAPDRRTLDIFKPIDSAKLRQAVPEISPQRAFNQPVAAIDKLRARQRQNCLQLQALYQSFYPSRSCLPLVLACPIALEGRGLRATLSLLSKLQGGLYENRDNDAESLSFRWNRDLHEGDNKTLIKDRF